MSKSEGKDRFGGIIPAFEQKLPGYNQPRKLGIRYRGVGKLGGKAALITGGDSGIGRSIAVLFAREGANVTIVYLPDEQKDAETTKSPLIEKENKKCLFVPFDLSNFKNCNTILDKHIAEYGKLDVLVNNASKQVQEEDFADINLDNVESSVQTNVIQMFAMTKLALPHMKKGGSIINTTSVVAFRGTTSMIDYAATKGAIVAFTRSLAKNLIKKGIRVNAVAPGPVDTPLQPASRPAEQKEGFGEGTQLGRLGQPSEIAPSFVFLESAAAELYNGQILHPYALGD